ncbi:MAG: hypothetical protein E7180_06200 [Erysipelotrichaceae bacterium]|nr:hypothetical protein [Erysipelotrichaceae bacterium]
MKGNILSKVLISLGLVGIITISGVSATFNYGIDDIPEFETQLNVGLGDFKWLGYDELPNEIEGQNHAALLNNLINGTTANGVVVGLNNPNSELNGYIDDRLDGGLFVPKRDYFGSMAVTGGAEMEAIFGTESAELSFIIQVVDDLNYYVYTTSVYLGERGELNWLNQRTKDGNPSIAIGEYIYAIYRSKLNRATTSSSWNIVETLVGKAKSAWYEENRSNATLTQIPSFDIKTWEEAPNAGKEFNTTHAIWTFVGDSVNPKRETLSENTYYRIKSKTARTITVSSTAATSTIRIYNEGRSLMYTSTRTTDAQNNTIVQVSFQAAANTMYYIEITGAVNIPFTVS